MPNKLDSCAKQEMIFLRQNQAVSYRNLNGKILGFMKDNKVCVKLEDNTILYCDREKLNVEN